MFHAHAEIMNTSVNTAIEVSVGLLKTSGNPPRMTRPIATSSGRIGKRALTAPTLPPSLRSDCGLPEQAVRPEREHDD
jgi:hypothetical protein